MLNVIFLRHAKSNFNSFNGDDFMRDISQNGIQKTKKVGGYLRNKNISFDEVLCSPSLRTKKTLDLISTFFKNKPEIKFLEDLYHKSGKNLFEVLMLNAQRKKCLVVSHEPLISHSIETFLNDYENLDFIRATKRFSTSSRFSVSFECQKWYEINKDIAKINFFKKPKDL